MRVPDYFRSSALPVAVAVAFVTVPRPAFADYTLSTVVAFNRTNGSGPVGNLTLSGGKLYGVTTFGGGSSTGTIFSLPLGTNALTTVTTFTTTNGSYPQAGLTAGADGNLYGTTAGGGPRDYGTVYRLNPATNAFNTLATFTSSGGRFPYSTVSVDAAGNLYGTTNQGGANTVGTIFKVDAGTNALSTLVTFNTANGANPQGGLTADSQGNLYGTTGGGGNGGGFGTVFELPAGASTLTTLATFNNTNGAYPRDDLTIDADGNLYGTTNRGGAGSDGTVYKIDANTHALSTLATFNGTNGFYPQSGLTLDANGNLYGTTAGNGTSNLGTVFKLNAADNTLTTLATFNGTNGSTPSGGVFVDATGNLYGTTNSGGANNQGTIFLLAVPEPGGMSLLFVGGVALVGRRRHA